MLTSKTTHTLTCDHCPRKTSTSSMTAEQLREAAAQRGWETRPAPEPDSPELDLCPACARLHPREEVRTVRVGTGRRPRKRRPFGRQGGGGASPAGPLTSPPPAGPATL